MEFTMEDVPDLTLPEDSIHVAKLNELKYDTFEWTDKKTNEKREGKVLEWWWEITATKHGSQLIGRKVRGRCDARLTNHPKNKFREWAEALLNRDIPIGAGIDTDDLVGLRAEIVIGLQKDKKDPSKTYEQVVDVIPLANGGQFQQDDEPPF